MTELIIKEKSIEIDGTKVFESLYTIKKILQFINSIVILLEIPNNEIKNENVLSFDYNGNFLWQIEKVKLAYEDSPYVDISKKDLNVRLINFDGTILDIKPQTGYISRRDWTK